MPEDVPEQIAEDMPDRMPEDMPDRMPEDMPDKMPEGMSDRTPEDLPATTCINVMVGITRSKVICFLLQFDPWKRYDDLNWPKLLDESKRQADETSIKMH